MCGHHNAKSVGNAVGISARISCAGTTAFILAQGVRAAVTLSFIAKDRNIVTATLTPSNTTWRGIMRNTETKIYLSEWRGKQPKDPIDEDDEPDC